MAAKTFLGFAALMSLAGGASAQDAPPTVIDDIVVEQQRPTEEAIRDFVKGITKPPPGHGPARWHGQVCVGAVNLRQAAAQVVIDRVAQAAEDVGLKSGEPGCDPNILIIATEDAGSLAEQLIETRPLAFRPNYSGASQSRAALERFRTSSAPVRWWHVSMPVLQDGSPAVRLPGGATPYIPGGGLLRTEVRNRLVRAFIILDIGRMGEINFQQLGDYAAMVALAQMDPDADTASFDSILNLFSEASPSPRLTNWDSQYLAALYGSELNQRNPNAQIGSIGGQMIQDRRRQDRAQAKETRPREP